MARQAVNMEDMYQDLLKRYHEVRNLSIGLLEEKRELLLRSQNENLAQDVISSSGACAGGCKRIFSDDDLDKDKKNQENCAYLGGDEISCDCKSATYLKELVKVNHKWQEKYETLLNDKKGIETKFEKFNMELQQERDENCRLRALVDKLSSDLQNLSPDIHLLRRQSETQSTDQICYTSDDIEALKQQLIAYQEDFDNERKDKAKAHNENKVLQEKLQKADDQIQALSDEKRRYKQCFGEVSQQKDHLISELRRLSTSTLPFSPVHQLPKSNFSTTSPTQDFIPRSSFRFSQRPNLVRASPESFMGAKAYEG